VSEARGDAVRLGPWSRPDAPLPGLAALIEAAVAADAIAPISGHVLAAVHGGDARVFPAQDDSGRDLVGVAVALAGDPAEVVVNPGDRGRGLGTALVRAAVDGQGAVWAYGNLPAARAVATRLDLQPTRVLLQMRRALPIEPTTAPLPAGVRLRTFEPGRDETAFLGVNARAFATHPEQGRLDLAGLRDEMAQDWFDPSGFFLAVADPGEQILGFHWTKVHPHDENVAGPIGEIYVLGVDPEAQVRGLGGVLADAGLRHLAERDLRTVMLYVEQDNVRAVRLYERFGFAVHRSNVVYRPRPSGA